MAGLFSCRIRTSNRQIVSHTRRQFAPFFSLGKNFFRPGTRKYPPGFRVRPPLAKPISAIADFLLG
jgi:hypothetical protein